MPNHLAPLYLGVSPVDAKVICVFVHGRNQSPEDISEQIIAKLVANGICYVLPRAAANSWYAARATDTLSDETRDELRGSLDYLRGTVVDNLREAGSEKPLVIGGFSQGACLVLEYAMKHGPWHGAMVNLTGCRVGTPSDDRPFADLDRMPVYLTGSDNDPWIPVDAFAQAVQALGKARARLCLDVFPDRAHEASDMEVSALDEILSQLASGRMPYWQTAGTFE
jgi:predicted esterase